MLSVLITLMPAASKSSTSSKRFRVRLPGAFVWASSSTRTTVGARAITAAVSISRNSHAAILRDERRHGLQVADLRGGFGPGVRLDVADHHVDSAPLEPVTLDEHLEGLAHARARAQVDLELALLLLVDERQEIFRLAA